MNFYPLPTSLHLPTVMSFVALMAHFTAILTICLHYGDAISRVQDDKSNFSIRWKTTPTFYCKDKVKVSFLKHDFVVWKKIMVHDHSYFILQMYMYNMIFGIFMRESSGNICFGFKLTSLCKVLNLL